jgi:hypothetical protein
MEEQLISFETAKLAKEKGFNIIQRIITVYDRDTLEETQNDEHGITQSLLQKWLRKEHKIHIEVEHSYRDLSHYSFHIYKTWEEYSKKMMKTFNDELIHFDSYESALEQGLLEALKLINK